MPAKCSPRSLADFALQCMLASLIRSPRVERGEIMKSVGGPERHLGLHRTLDGYGGSPGRPGDPNTVRGWLDELPDTIEMTKPAEPVLVEVGRRSTKDTGGTTGFVLLAESHISLRAFPLPGFASADVYTCQDHLDKEPLLESFRGGFGLAAIEHNMIIRKRQYPLQEIHDDIERRLPDRDPRHSCR